MVSHNRTYRFSGFHEGATATVRLPESIFSDLLPNLDDIDEVKVVLHVLWRLAGMRAEGAPWITDRDLLSDAVLRMGLPGQNYVTRLQGALAKSVDHGVLLAVPSKSADDTVEVRYFANSPQGRSSVEALRRGVALTRATVEERPNIFALYEQTIGPLTALLSEDLMDAERTYPAEWIEDAFREAARLNKRNWKYILAILEHWQSEGRDGTNRQSGREAGKQDREAETRRYIDDAYDRLVHH